MLSGLKKELQHPEVIAEYVRTYHEERKRLAADAIKGRARIERRLAAIQRDVDRLVDAICDGSAVIQQLEPKFLALGAEQEKLRKALETAPELRRTPQPSPRPEALPQGEKGAWGSAVAEDRFRRKRRHPDVRYCLRCCA